MKVLHRAGVAAEVAHNPHNTPATQRWDEFTWSGEYLGGPGAVLLGVFSDKYGWPIFGVTRTRLQTLLMDACRANGIPIHTGWRLADLREVEDGVVARSEDGREIQARFVVGADGLKSRTRDLLMGKRGLANEAPNFTGIVVLGGASPTPDSMKSVAAIRIWYGATITMISHTLEDGMSVWGLNYGLNETKKESWRTIPKREQKKENAKTQEKHEGWAQPVRELVAGTRKMMTIGRYDRPELPVEQWYHGRVVLVGDAAHPTT